MQKTACYRWHTSHGGRMVDFAGWEMPVQYRSIIQEHQAVRTAAGLFDVAHMGRLCFTGPDACRFLDHLVTNDVASLEVGQVRYALVTNAEGGILDDVLVYRFGDFYMLVVNASNRLKICDWIQQLRNSFDVTVDDRTLQRFMLAIQGPRAVDILNPLLEPDVSQMKYYTAIEASIIGQSALVSRTGYTGEDGFEIILPSEYGFELWETLMDAGQEQGIQPAGLGCRDTLRLEAAMPLYGHELNESIDPFTAGLSFAVKLDAGDFVGKQALITAKANTNRKRRVGLELKGRRIAREGAEIYTEGQHVGSVCSGTFSPTLEKTIAMGYVSPDHSKVGTKLEIDIRGKRTVATIVKLPFYRRA